MRSKLTYLFTLITVFIIIACMLVGCSDNNTPKPNAVITIVDGQFYEDGKPTGVTLQDAVTVSYSQVGETLDVNLTLDIQYYDYFDSVDYSITRDTNLQFKDILYNKDVVIDITDYTAENEVVDKSHTQHSVGFSYHGNWHIDVNLHKDGEVIATVTQPINVKASHYNISYYNATVPLLLNTTQLYCEQQQGVTYMCIDRTNTFDWNNLPDNVYPMPSSYITQATTNLGLFDDNGNQLTCEYGKLNWGSWGQPVLGNDYNSMIMKQWIADLYAMDNSATFTFGGIDSRLHPILIYSYGNNIPESQFEINIYADGSGSLHGVKSANLTDINKYNQYKEQVLDWIENSATTFVPVPTIITGYHFAYTLAEKSNVTYYVHDFDTMLANIPSEQVKQQFQANNIVNLPIATALQNVVDAGQMEAFEYLLRLRWIDNNGNIGTAEQYFVTDKEDSLMIIGASPITETENLVKGTFLELMQWVVNHYGEQCNILYKGHPSWPLNSYSDGAERQKFFDKYGITVLPNATPAETYMFLYENVLIGGYYSTTFASSQKGQTLFFFGEENQIKAKPSLSAMFDKTDSNYQGIFENSLFITSGVPVEW